MGVNSDLHKIVSDLVDILKLQQNQIENLQRQINNIVKAPLTLNVKEEIKEGLANLHKMALGDPMQNEKPEKIEKTDEEEDEDRF